MKYYKILRLSFLFLFIPCYSQEEPNLILSYVEESEISFYQYPEDTFVKKIYTSQSEVITEYPEQLLESIISATNQEWVNYNTLGGEEKASKKNDSHFERVRKMNRDSNYFRLSHKLSFMMGGIPTVMIKFFTHFENMEELSGVAVMQKVDNRWQKTSHPSLSTLSIIVMRIKSEVLEGVVLQNSNNPDIVSIAERVNTEQGLDFTLLEEEFASWYSPEKDEIKINLYKDPKSW